MRGRLRGLLVATFLGCLPGVVQAKEDTKKETTGAFAWNGFRLRFICAGRAAPFTRGIRRSAN